MALNEKFLFCSFCNNKFDHPILLPCNESICFKHVEEIESNKSIDCPICSECHTIPENGFPPDAKRELLLSVNIKQKPTLNQNSNPVNFNRLNELYKSYSELKENLKSRKKTICLFISDQHKSVLFMNLSVTHSSQLRISVRITSHITLCYIK